MNIYAKKGDKVRCFTLFGGSSDDEEIAQAYLELAKIYTIEQTEVHAWHTNVWLKEFPNVKFNSVYFKNIS